MKTGYFVITHDIDNIDINFLQETPESKRLFKDFNSNLDNDEMIANLWSDFIELYNDTIECWYDGKWKFNGYNILDVFTIYIY